jgi:hypothetical protein
MLTVKSILTGALVLGAASVPAGVVVTDLATDSVPAAPEAIAVEAPTLVPTGVVFEEPFVSAFLIPLAPTPAIDVRDPEPFEDPFLDAEFVSVVLVLPAPARVVGVEAPRLDAPELALEDAVLTRVSIAPPSEVNFDRA